MYDYIFKNATVIDGTGQNRYKSNVALFAGTIALVTNQTISRAKNVIDCEGKILSPGFIDMHCHTDFEILRDRDAKARIGQGITTDVTGNCGIGTFPYNNPYLKSLVGDVLGDYPDWAWSDYPSWRSYVENGGIGSNQIYLVSHSALRVAAMGDDPGREASDDEINKMCSYLDQALTEGAYGFSSGLYYSPCIYANRSELVALLKCVKKHDKIFSVHHRCEGDDVVKSLKEVLDLALDTGVRLEVSHLKAIGVKNQDKVDTLLSMIDEYREKDVDVKFDQYPYTFGSTSLYSLLPPSILAFSRYEQRLALSLENERDDLRREILNPNGWDSIYEMVGPDNIKALFLETHPEMNGKSLSEIGKMLSKDPLDALFTVLSEETGLAVMEDITTTDENLKKIMSHSLMCFGSDSLYSSPLPHPRSYHCAIEFLAHYVRDEKVLSLEEGIKKMTGEPASRLNIRRGIIKEGYPADITIFDLDKLKVNEDNTNSGIEYVFVNGEPAISEGKFTGKRGGKVI